MAGDVVAIIVLYLYLRADYTTSNGSDLLPIAYCD
jgi:hypothetical protein